MVKDWDLNLWFRENVVDDEVVMDDVITINPAIYINERPDDFYGAVSKVYTGILYRCTPEETAKIRAFRSEQEYGDDWLTLGTICMPLRLARVFRTSLTTYQTPIV